MPTRLVLTIVLLVACAGAAVAALPVAAQAPIDDPFPMAAGTYWVYEGPVKWTVPNSADVREANLSWTMSVTEAITTTGPTSAAVLEGHPLDLAGYEEGLQPGRHLILRIAPGRYYLASSAERLEMILPRLRDPNDALVGLIGEGELFLDLPMAVGDRFGETAQLTRADGMYVWEVTGQETITLPGVKGVDPAREWTEYEVTLRTLSGDITFGFAPGLGLTRWAYGHHGTVSNVDVRLTEFNPRTGRR